LSLFERKIHGKAKVPNGTPISGMIWNKCRTQKHVQFIQKENGTLVGNHNLSFDGSRSPQTNSNLTIRQKIPVISKSTHHPAKRMTPRDFSRKVKSKMILVIFFLVPLDYSQNFLLGRRRPLAWFVFVQLDALQFLIR